MTYLTSIARPLGLFAVVSCLLLLIGTGVELKAGDRPNILFIMTDQQSGDAMSCRMGDRYMGTPTMDRLARTGTLFTRAYAPNPLCMPARNSIFTGRYPHETGVTKNARPAGGSLAPEFVCMGNYFRDAGYKTAYSGKWHLCLKEKDTERHGFQILDRKKKLIPPEDDNYDARVAHAAVEFLEHSHDRPFLLVVSFMNPHNICEWARRLAGREQRLSCGEIGTPPSAGQLPPPPANLAPPSNEPDGMTLIRRAYQVEDGKFPVADFGIEDWRKDRWGYYRMVEKVDGEMAKVMNALRNAGLEENTLVVFTSDHGDCAGAHQFNQKTVLYEESVRIPLIVQWAGKTNGAVCDKLVNTGVDILPTLLEVAGIERPAILPGRSLLDATLGRAAGEWREYVVSGNNLAQTGKIDGFRPSMEGRMVRSERYKYCVFSYGIQRESLYDLIDDPLETVNLAVDPDYHGVVLEHRKRLQAFGVAQHDGLVAELLADDVGPRKFLSD